MTANEKYNCPNRIGDVEIELVERPHDQSILVCAMLGRIEFNQKVDPFLIGESGMEGVVKRIYKRILREHRNRKTHGALV